MTVTQIHHQVNPGFNVAIVKDGHIMHAAVLTRSIFAKTVPKTIKTKQYLTESKTLHHFLQFNFHCSLCVHITLYSFVFIVLCLYGFVFYFYCSLCAHHFLQFCFLLFFVCIALFLLFFACMIFFQYIGITFK